MRFYNTHAIDGMKGNPHISHDKGGHHGDHMMVSGSVKKATPVLMLVLLLVAGCGNLNPFQPDPGLRSLDTPVHKELLELPRPQEKMVAAVYRFRDQTGQYQPSDNIASWSTAVTQGATSILLKAIDDSGWFTPIERESISNLMNERQIIQSIRAEHGQVGPLPPMMYAGVMLEGGIIGYDSNIMTGGAGARYLGIGGSSEFRQDKVTIYLRAVSTQNSRILKTVHSTETILSQKVDAHIFRFVDEDKIIEGEAGYTVNEPSTIAVTRAIEKAVEKLVMEGIRDQLWAVASDEEEFLDEYFAAYDQRQVAKANIDVFGRQITDRRGNLGLGLNLGGQRYRGNYPDPLTRPFSSVDLMVRLSPRLFGGLSVNRGEIAAKHEFEKTFSGAQLSVRGVLFPDYSITPFLEIGGGAMVLEDGWFRPSWDDYFPYVSGAAGLEYMLTEGVGIHFSVRHRYALKDGLDGVQLGRYNDRVWSFGGGVTFYRF